jgi:hypothetical protein
MDVRTTPAKAAGYLEGGTGMKARRNGTAHRQAWTLAVAVVALLAFAFAGRPQASQATVGDGDVVLGVQASVGCTPGVNPNCANSITGIHNTATNGDTAFAAIASTSGTGVFGHSPTGDGVQGSTLSGTGVHGQTLDPSGIGVFAQGPTIGLKVSGSAVFSRSGSLTIPSGSSTGKVKHLNLTSSSLVLATIQGDIAGVNVRGVTIVPGQNGSFTVHLNNTAPSAVVVGWFVVN